MQSPARLDDRNGMKLMTPLIARMGRRQEESN